MEKIATCIKEHGNWGSKLTKELRMDNTEYNPIKVKEVLAIASPKLNKLIETIHELDAKDLKKHGKLFKHFIYSDIKSAYGAKLMASILQSDGFHHAYRLKKTTRGMSFALDLKKENKNNTFAILTSVAFYEKPIGVQFRRELLKTYNQRPSNSYGENIRIIVLDSGFREGVDLFDVKYVHLMESITTLNDQKQAIGRATRFCGQKGLNFDSVKGWPLHVYRYETTVPEDIKKHLEKDLPSITPADDFFQMFLRYSNIDPKKIAFANELERVVIANAADKEYTKNIHDFKIGGSKSNYHWPPVKVENLCVDPPSTAVQDGKPAAAPLVTFSPTQDFVRENFTPKNPNHGMLLFHSVGTGKTCTAIATASSTFEQDDYTILYVTRYTLKPDVWKNMFDQVCSVVVQAYLKSGKTLPEAQAAKLRLISKKWIEPLSYRQLSNMLDGKNKFSDKLYEYNGRTDPLHKTLLIIDEAHKLFAADVEGQEKADIDVIRKSLNNSYEKSGKESVKVLMMTATPYTSDAMDMIRLMNLIMKNKFPEEFEEFSKTYLDDQGKFSEEGLNKFNKEMTGMVSYLNREKDIRSFAYPIFKEIRVPMSDYGFMNEMYQYVNYKAKLNGQVDDFISDSGNYKKDLAKYEQELYQMVEMVYNMKKKEVQLCYNNLDIFKNNVSEILKKYKSLLNKCKETSADCIKEIKKKYKIQEKEWRDDLKIELKNKSLEEKKLLKKEFDKKILNAAMDKDFDIQKCNLNINNKLQTTANDCEKKLIKSYKAKEKSLRDALKVSLKETDKTKEEKDLLKDEFNKTIIELNLNKNIDIQTCNDSINISECNKNANIYRDKELEKNNKIVEHERALCDVKKEQFNEWDTKQKEFRKSEVKKKADEINKKLNRAENKINIMKKVLVEKENILNDKIKNDTSQRNGLEECLKPEKYTPYYKKYLSSKVNIDDKDKDNTNTELIVNDEKIYLISGHGSEIISKFPNRNVMPKDKVLVLLPECGRYNYIATSCKFQDIFSDPSKRKWLRNPIKYKSQIENKLQHSIRIYLPGEYVPNLYTNLFLNVNKENNEKTGKVIIAKSGVFRNFYPINRDIFIEPTQRHNLGDQKCIKYAGMIDSISDYTTDIHKEVFKGNIYPPASKGTSYEDLERNNFSIRKILNDIGPGIYYYTGCRYSSTIPEDFEKVIHMSEEQQDKSKRTVRIGSLPMKLLGVDNIENHEVNKIKIRKKTNEDENVEVKPEEVKPEVKPIIKKKYRKPKVVITKEDTDILKEYELEINDLYDEIIQDEKYIGTINKTIEEKINKWKDLLQKVPSTVLQKRLIHKLIWIESILNETEPSEVIQSEIIDTEYIQLSTAYQFKNKYTKNRKTFYDKMYGVIPLSLNYDDDKCSANSLLKRITRLYNNGKKIKLPQQIIKWTPKVIKEICTSTRSMIQEI